MKDNTKLRKLRILIEQIAETAYCEDLFNRNEEYRKPGGLIKRLPDHKRKLLKTASSEDFQNLRIL